MRICVKLKDGSELKGESVTVQAVQNGLLVAAEDGTPSFAPIDLVEMIQVVHEAVPGSYVANEGGTVTETPIPPAATTEGGEGAVDERGGGDIPA